MGGGWALAEFQERDTHIHTHTHLLGTILETLAEGGVGRRAGLGAGAELDAAVGELAFEDAHVAVAFGAGVGDGHREAVAGHLRLDGGVVRHGGDGNRHGGVWKMSRGEREREGEKSSGFSSR